MGAMEIGGLLNNRSFITANERYSQQFQQHSMQMNPHQGYSMNHNGMAHHQQHHPLNQHLAYPTMGPPPPQQIMPTSYMTSHQNPSMNGQMDLNTKPKSEPAPKSFSCGTCNKGFARRSDLARHERIHSGVRPHACDFPGCGKQFIQRSALTVHARVHTGEKPHMCERCGKPFSDSSSLARHRRIHSGTRPYKCPFANCQKTFTRRTTLTRHQNHHTGTVEQAEVETNAKLSATQPMSRTRSSNASFSDVAGSSRTSTASPTQQISMSPTQDMSSMAMMQRQNSDFQYATHSSQAIPSHMRPDYHQMVSRPTQPMNGPTMNAYTSTPQQRHHMTSHPQGFGPPQTLEPPPSGTASGAASPHMTGMNWASPNHGILPSPGHMDPYVAYQDPTYANQQMFYHNNNIRRPQSTEPEEFNMRPRQMTHHLTTGSIPMATEWNTMPMNMHEIKQERGYAI